MFSLLSVGDVSSVVILMLLLSTDGSTIVYDNPSVSLGTPFLGDKTRKSAQPKGSPNPLSLTSKQSSRCLGKIIY